MNFQVHSSMAFDQVCDLLCVGILDGGHLPAALLAAMGDGFADLVKREAFEGKAEKSLSLKIWGLGPRRLLLCGLGMGQPEELRCAAGAAGREAREMGATVVWMDFSAAPLDEHASRALIEAFRAGSYVFDRYLAEGSRKAPCADLHLVSGCERSLTIGNTVADAVDLVRDLVNEPADTIHPETLAAAAMALASPTLQVHVWDEHRIRAEGMNGIWSVGKSSLRPPRFVHMHYKPATEPLRRLALVGKGVTFDAGGLCIKPTDAMGTMKCDMAGAATVIGIMKALDALQPPVEVHGIFAAAENMLGGAAFKPGDVLRMHNGKTVEVNNTDAEGRLLLADCLSYASGLGVEAVVDLATLTGACFVALGSHYSGLFTGDDALAAELLRAASIAGEEMWRLPHSERFAEDMKSTVADMKNTGSRWGGASSAAWFLSQFVDGPRWAHLDIAGTAFFEKGIRYLGVGGTGIPLRAMLAWILGATP